MSISIDAITLISAFICALIVVSCEFYSFGKRVGYRDARTDLTTITVKLTAKIDNNEESNDFYKGAFWVLDNIMHKEK